MRQPNRIVVEVDQNIFRAPPDSRDDSAVQRRGEIVADAGSEPRLQHLDAEDAAADHARTKTAADRLDFGKLRHDLQLIWVCSGSARPLNGPRELAIGHRPRAAI